MTNPTIPQRVLFPELVGKPVVATFDREQASSDGGAVLLKAAERVYDLVKGFARCLVDKRAPEKIRHTLEDLIGQRVFGIACGHPDGNDADHLAEDPIHKLLLGRDPVTGERLASQPTLSRFENGVGRGALYRMARELAESVIERHRQRRQGRARRITIDLDPTDDPTHGAQQLTFFNGFYDTWCYLPLLAFVTFGREAEQYLCAAVLRSGKAVASEGAVALLSRLLPLLRCAFPRARFLVRLDAGFATPEVFDFLDACPRLDYVISIPKNAVLVRHAEPAMTRARARSARSGRTEHVYGETRYAAGSWKQQRRVVILGPAERGFVGELRGHRNRWAHQEAFSGDDAYRALDTAHRLLTAVSAAQAADVEKLKMELLRVRFDEQARGERRKQASLALGSTAGTLKPWREVVTPHRDVASGRYQQAEFAADLWQVHLGEGTDEYRDPVESSSGAPT